MVNTRLATVVPHHFTAGCRVTVVTLEPVKWQFLSRYEPHEMYSPSRNIEKSHEEKTEQHATRTVLQLYSYFSVFFFTVSSTC